MTTIERKERKVNFTNSKPVQIKQLLKSGTDFLDDRVNALLDCEILLCHVLGVEREALIANSGCKVDIDLERLFHIYLERLKKGQPVAYLTQKKEFFGFDFFVDKRVLIPRPESELLVHEALDFLDDQTDARVLDVGTGSGNLACAIAKSVYANLNQIDALDVSYDACDVARINVQQHCLSEKVYVFQSDLFDSVDEEAYYDVIVVNLPYIGEGRNRYVSEETEKYEPGNALFGGFDGLVLYKKMFHQILDMGIRFKILIGEFGYGQGKDIRKLLGNYFDRGWSIKSDLAGIERLFVVGNESVNA